MLHTQPPFFFFFIFTLFVALLAIHLIHPPGPKPRQFHDAACEVFLGLGTFATMKKNAWRVLKPISAQKLVLILHSWEKREIAFFQSEKLHSDVQHFEMQYKCRVLKGEAQVSVLHKGCSLLSIHVTLRHNVKFPFSSMTLHLISGQGSMSHAQRPHCACASIHWKPNRLRPGPRCHSENRCRRRAINHDLAPNTPKQCKQFVDEAENECSPYIYHRCMREEVERIVLSRSFCAVSMQKWEEPPGMFEDPGQG